MATKFQQTYKEMVEENQELFDRFKTLHDSYSRQPKLYQQEFNQLGEQVMDIIIKWDKRLCGKSERSGYGSYTSGLSEKFWDHVRKHFPKIDSVGLKIS